MAQVKGDLTLPLSGRVGIQNHRHYYLINLIFMTQVKWDLTVLLSGRGGIQNHRQLGQTNILYTGNKYIQYIQKYIQINVDVQ
jgi:hypothetical protein